jgi:hypothetical protein
MRRIGTPGFRPSRDSALPPNPPALIPGRVHGLREWLVSTRGFTSSDVYLASSYNGELWHPRVTGANCTEASFLREVFGEREGHDAPHAECGCGLYAYHPAPELSASLARSKSGLIGGIVEAWGRIELHEQGFRGQFARPLALVLPLRFASDEDRLTVVRLADRYQAQIIKADEPDDVWRHCLRYDLGLRPPVVAELLCQCRRVRDPAVWTPYFDFGGSTLPC